MKKIQKFSCVNSAAFVMHFRAFYYDENTSSEVEIFKTDNYPVGQERTIDLSIHEVPEGSKIWIETHAVAGKSKMFDEHKYEYSKNNHSQVFRITGTTLSYTINEL